eukprot:5764627-Alexandrium_andersonii.AAC.1
MWFPVGSDLGVAAVTAATATVPVRTVTSSGPVEPEERASRDKHNAMGRSTAAAADGGGAASSS